MLSAVLIAPALAPLAVAAEYHVASGEALDATGSEADPFPSIQACADAAGPGDTCVVHGGVYRETVTPPTSGTADAPLRFVVADGERAIVTGLDRATGWTDEGDGRWSTAPGATVLQLFVDKRPGIEARWPSSEPDWLHPRLSSIDSVTQDGEGLWTVHDAALTEGAAWVVPVRKRRTERATAPTEPTGFASPQDWRSQFKGLRAPLGDASEPSPRREPFPDGNWVGGRAWYLHEYRWTAASAEIVAAGDGWLQLSGVDDSYPPAEGSPWFVYGQSGVLDTHREWLQDDAGTVHLVLDDGPDVHELELRTRQWGFDLADRSNVELSGFDLFAASVRMGGSGNVLADSRVLFPGVFDDASPWSHADGVLVSGHDNTVTGCEITHTWGDGVSLDRWDAWDNVIDDNIITDVNWLAGGGAAVNSDHSPGNQITNNSIADTGRSGILHRWDSFGTRIEGNDVADFGWPTRDLGGIYTYGRGAGEPVTVITGNHVHGGRADRYVDGIYVDSYSNDIEITRNLVWDVTVGVRLNAPGDSMLQANNTLWDVETANMTYGTEGWLFGTTSANNLSNDDAFVGTTLDANLAVDADCFVDADGLDLDLAEGCAAIDAGVDVAGVTEGYLGAAPDVGACEQGAGCPSAGASWTAEARNWYPLQTVGVTTDLSLDPTGAVDDGALLTVGSEDGSGDWRSLLLFPRPDLEGGRLVRASLQFELVDTDPYGYLQLGRVTEAWDAATADRSLVDSAEPLAFIAMTSDGPAWDAPKPGTYSVDVTRTVAGWVDGSLPVAGFALSAAEGYSATRRVLSSLEGSAPPLLVLEVEPGEAGGDTGTPGDGGSDDGGSADGGSDDGGSADGGSIDGGSTSDGGAGSKDSGGAPDKSGCSCSSANTGGAWLLLPVFAALATRRQSPGMVRVARRRRVRG